MNTKEINYILKTNLEKIDCFIGTFARNMLPKITKKPAVIILNNDTSKEPGSHWVAIFFSRDGRGIYFDSFGLPLLHENIIEYLNSNSENGWIYSNMQLQSLTSNTCGHFCILFVIMICNGFILPEILNLFTKKLQ